jgi:hypothetical protein
VQKTPGGPLEAVGRRLDALVADLTNGQLALHEWSTIRSILEGSQKFGQLKLQLELFNEARNSGWTIWGRPQGSSFLIDVTGAEQEIGTYLHWRGGH